MQVDYMVLADAAAAVEGKHYIHGGGWDVIAGVSFPLTYTQIAVALRLRVPWNETNQQHQLELDVVNEDEKSILPSPPGPIHGVINAGRPPNIAAGMAQTVPVVINLMALTFAEPGMYVVRLRINNLDASRAVFQVTRLGATITLSPT